MLLKRHDVKVIVEMLMGMEIAEEEFELNEMNISAVCEVMNQMMGASSTALSEFLGRMVNISTPISFEVKNEEEFIDKYFVDGNPKVVVGFALKIDDKLESEFYNVMPIELAKGLVKGFIPDEAIVDVSGDQAEEAPAPAPVQEAASEKTEEVPQGGGTLSQEEIERLLNGDVGADSPAAASQSTQPAQAAAEAMLQGTVQPQMGTAAPSQAPAGAAAMPVQPGVGQDMSMMQMQMMQQMMQQMQAMQQELEARRKEPDPKLINVQPAARPNLSQSRDIVLEGKQEENMELIMGVPLEISVEIGRTQKLVKDILDFTKGSLVVLDKLAGEQVDLFVNGQCIAKGDVVVVEDNFGIRITEIMKVNFAVLE